MIAIIDGGEPKEVLNSVKVIIGDGKEIHINISHEGVITDFVSHGEVVGTCSEEHDTSFFEEDDDPEERAWTKGEED